MQKDVVVLRKGGEGEGELRAAPLLTPQTTLANFFPVLGFQLDKALLFPPLPAPSVFLRSHRRQLDVTRTDAASTPLRAHLLHHTDDAGDEGVRVLVLLGAGVQVHASLLKHHLRAGTSEGRGLEGSQWERTRGGAIPRWAGPGSGESQIPTN